MIEMLNIVYNMQNERNIKYNYSWRLYKRIKEYPDNFVQWWQANERLKDENGIKAHPTQKPLKLIQHVLLTATNKGDLVLDPFFGTGTTGIVPKALHRNWIGIEKEKIYVDLANHRIENFITKQRVIITILIDYLYELNKKKHGYINSSQNNSGNLLFY